MSPQVVFQLGYLLLHAGGHLVPVSVRLPALPDEALELGRNCSGDVAVEGLVGVPVRQGDHPQLTGDTLLSLDDLAFLQTDQTGHLALVVVDSVGDPIDYDLLLLPGEVLLLGLPHGRPLHQQGGVGRVPDEPPDEVDVIFILQSSVQ